MKPSRPQIASRATRHRLVRGQIIPIFAIFATILVGFAALAIDGANDSAIQIRIQDAAHATAVSLAHSWKSFPPSSTPGTALTASTPIIQAAANIAALNGLAVNQSYSCTPTSNTTTQFDVVFFDNASATGATAAACETTGNTSWKYAVEVQVPPIPSANDPTPPQCSPTYECVGVVGTQKVWQYIPVAAFGGSSAASEASASDIWDTLTPTAAVTTSQTTNTDTDPTEQISGASCPTAAVCWYSGVSGVLHVWTGNQASKVTMSPGNNNKLNGISCSSNSACYAVGASGTLYYANSTSGPATAETSNTTVNLSAISCPGNSSHCVAVDAGGTALWGTHGAWSTYSENTAQLNGVSCVNSESPSISCLAVGPSGVVDYFNGTTWTVQTAISGTPNMNAISCIVGTTTCFAVGDGGVIWKTTSLSSPVWSSEASGTTQNLNGISCATATVCDAVGDNGTTLHTIDGTNWILDGSGNGNKLHAVSCALTSRCSDGGDDDTILQAILPPPGVTGVSPSVGATAGGTSVTITGTGFTGATGVSFGGTAAASFTVNSSTQITATTAAGSGTVDVTVTTANGTSEVNSADHYTYANIPTITVMGNNRGPTTGGQFVMIGGSNFTGATAVKFGSNAATAFGVDSANLIWAQVPAGSAGTVDITITTSAGTSSPGSVDQYTYYAAGGVYNWGEDDNSELGDGQTTNKNSYVTPTGEGSGVILIADGSDSSFLVTSAGAVYATGVGTAGSLGNGGTASSSTYTATSMLTSGVVQIEGLFDGGIALKSDGTVWDWGDDYYGENGNGTACGGAHPTEPCAGATSPVQVSGLTGIVQISGTGHTGIALKNDGTVWTWGASPYGELGNGTTANSSTPVEVVTGASGCATYLCNIISIAGGGGHVVALDANGAVWAWGRNNAGQLGNNSISNSTSPVAVSGLSSGVSQIAAGGFASYAMLSSGGVDAWGDNGYGELGNGAASCGADPCAGSKTPTAVKAVGGGSNLTGVVQISGDYEGAYALTTAGAVIGWGENSDYFELGNGGSANSNTPVQVSGLTSGMANLQPGGSSMSEHGKVIN